MEPPEVVFSECSSRSPLFPIDPLTDRLPRECRYLRATVGNKRQLCQGSREGHDRYADHTRIERQLYPYTAVIAALRASVAVCRTHRASPVRPSPLTSDFGGRDGD